MRDLAKKVLAGAGYQISKLERSAHRAEALSPHQACLLTALSFVEELRIVQIGANDGAINDPIHTFAATYSKRTSLVLVEPQEVLIPLLEKNYAFHPKKKIFNGAVGPSGTLRLYAVDPAFWDQLDVPYAREWPTYRAPTGVTSGDRTLVRAWAAKHLRNPAIVDRVIMELKVPCLRLAELLQALDMTPTVDFLQIDAEGLDDEVIYHSDIDVLLPKIIAFEAKHLPADRYDRLASFLLQRNYVLSRQGKEALAILTES